MPVHTLRDESAIEQELVDVNAAIADRVPALLAERDVYRMMSSCALGLLHVEMSHHTRTRQRLTALRDELRRYISNQVCGPRCIR